MIDAALLSKGIHPDPFAVLGRHGRGEQVMVRAFIPVSYTHLDVYKRQQ